MLSPSGALIHTVKLKGKNPTNVTFGGPDRKTIYVTLQERGAVEYFRNSSAGRE
ncbi:SMP-30/Gluconolaconase/LRE-like region [compost metagenome]